MSINPLSAAAIDSPQQSESPIEESDDQRGHGDWARFGLAIAWLALRDSACGVGSTVELWDVLVERREAARKAKSERSRAA